MQVVFKDEISFFLSIVVPFKKPKFYSFGHVFNKSLESYYNFRSAPSSLCP